MDNKNKSLGERLGTILAQVVVSCIFICLAAIVISLTAKFLGWLWF